MDMKADPLIGLKDIYLPVEPHWWPPAPGWWLLAALTIALTCWLTLIARRRWIAFRPIRAARRIVDTLIEEEATTSSSDALLANQCNEILKRLLVIALEMKDLGKISGEDWLKALDTLGACTDFSQGPGRALGQERFAAEFTLNRLELLICVNKLLRKIHPHKSKITFMALS